MAATRLMEGWDAGDFQRYFRNAANTSHDPTFADTFHALATALEPIDREFLRETASCGRSLAGVLEQLEQVTGRSGYCRRPRGFGAECDVLYGEAQQVRSRLEDLREVCFR